MPSKIEKERIPIQTLDPFFFIHVKRLTLVRIDQALPLCVKVPVPETFMLIQLICMYMQL
ncbi:hypothetical protein [Sporosarcina saromensis]|uniref:hypothetical protein n=1 Tax=Sporosarcina saromensis TaxID=359365 RepID=UPI00295F484C|nr:hypothetical protein [Sporosarcina saromensis]